MNRKALISLLLAGSLAAGAALTGYALPSESIATAELIQLTDDQLEHTGVAEVAKNVMPAMVSITNTSLQDVNDWFRGSRFQYESTSLGTGIIVGEKDGELLIVSNNHVVDDADELTVSFIDETSVNGKVKGTDARNDLAVVSVKMDDIPAETRSQIRVANVIDSSNERVGEQVVAIGNALGYGQSVTTGIISALNRSIQVDADSYEELIQTDAAINHGNSGGALLNMKGEVIGINSVKAGASGVEGMGYAIPTSKALPIIEKLMEKETRDKTNPDQAPFLGITGQDVTKNVAQVYGIPEGIYITEVTEGTPAAEAGLTQGMIITHFDDMSIDDMSDLQEILEYYAAGETIPVTVSVQGDDGSYESKDIDVTLGARSGFSG